MDIAETFFRKRPSIRYFVALTLLFGSCAGWADTLTVGTKTQAAEVSEAQALLLKAFPAVEFGGGVAAFGCVRAACGHVRGTSSRQILLRKRQGC